MGGRGRIVEAEPDAHLAEPRRPIDGRRHHRHGARPARARQRRGRELGRRAGGQPHEIRGRRFGGQLEAARVGDLDDRRGGRAVDELARPAEDPDDDAGQRAAHGGALDLTANPCGGRAGFPLAGGGRVGAGGRVFDLLTGGDAVLEDALGAGAGRVGVAALGLGLRHGRRRFVGLIDEPGVVDARHRLPGGDAIAFAHQDLGDSPRDLRRHLGVAVGKRRHRPAQLDRVLDGGSLDGRAADRALAGRSFRLLAPVAAAHEDRQQYRHDHLPVKGHLRLVIQPRARRAFDLGQRALPGGLRFDLGEPTVEPRALRVDEPQQIDAPVAVALLGHAPHLLQRRQDVGGQRPRARPRPLRPRVSVGQIGVQAPQLQRGGGLFQGLFGLRARDRAAAQAQDRRLEREPADEVGRRQRRVVPVDGQLGVDRRPAQPLLGANVRGSRLDAGPVPPHGRMGRQEAHQVGELTLPELHLRRPRGGGAIHGRVAHRDREPRRRGRNRRRRERRVRARARPIGRRPQHVDARRGPGLEFLVGDRRHALGVAGRLGEEARPPLGLPQVQPGDAGGEAPLRARRLDVQRRRVGIGPGGGHGCPALAEDGQRHG